MNLPGGQNAARRFDPAEFPPWLHDDVAWANRDVSEAIKTTELDFGWINQFFDALERVLVYRAAQRIRDGKPVTIGRHTMYPESP